MTGKLKPAVAAILHGILFQLSAFGQEAGRSPTDAYADLLKDYRPASFGLRDAKTDEERKAAVERMGTFAPRFIELAEKHPADPVVFEILRQAIQIVGSTDSGALTAWEMNRSSYPTGSAGDCADRIVLLLVRHHLRSERIGPLIDRMRYGYRLEFEDFMTLALKENPNHDIQGLACLSLAQFLNDRMRMLQLVNDRPELSECYKIVFGEDYFTALRRFSGDGVTEQIEPMFERAAREFPEVKIRGRKIGDIAKSELYELRNLSNGMNAPEITGIDQEGVEFKLSDYRGKVVLLYFWSEY